MNEQLHIALRKINKTDKKQSFILCRPGTGLPVEFICNSARSHVRHRISFTRRRWQQADWKLKYFNLHPMLLDKKPVLAVLSSLFCQHCLRKIVQDRSSLKEDPISIASIVSPSFFSHMNNLMNDHWGVTIVDVSSTPSFECVVSWEPNDIYLYFNLIC